MSKISNRACCAVANENVIPTSCREGLQREQQRTGSWRETGGEETEHRSILTIPKDLSPAGTGDLTYRASRAGPPATTAVEESPLTPAEAAGSPRRSPRSSSRPFPARWSRRAACWLAATEPFARRVWSHCPTHSSTANHDRSRWSGRRREQRPSGQRRGRTASLRPPRASSWSLPSPVASSTATDSRPERALGSRLAHGFDGDTHEPRSRIRASHARYRQKNGPSTGSSPASATPRKLPGLPGTRRTPAKRSSCGLRPS